MKETKLIPLREFVNRIDELVPREIDQSFGDWKLKQFGAIKRYASFLLQPLKLEMFVPVDDEGNILTEPEWSEPLSIEEKEVFEHEQYLYDKAKSNVLFEGFELKNGKIKNKEGCTVFLYNSENNRFSDDSTENYTIDTIELLLEYCICDLTPTALTQIYG